MDSESGCFSRHFRNVSSQRLILYGVIVVSAIVVLILIFTLLLSGGDNNGPSTPKPQPDFVGHDVLKTTPLIDGYNNLPMLLWDNLKGHINDFKFDTDLSKETWLKTDIPRLKLGMVGCQVWTVKPKCSSENKDSIASTIRQLDAMIRLNKKYKDNMMMVYDSKDINQAFQNNKFGNMMSIDGGHSIDNKLSVLRTYYAMGVRSMSLTSDCDTVWATSYKTKVKDDLSNFGEKVIEEMNRLGMIIDLSQSSEATQKKVLGKSKAPVIFSSTAVWSYKNAPSNIKDDVLDLVKKNKGLVMITFNPDLMKKTETDTVTINNVVEQINYVKNKIGVDHVGIGSGFGASTSTNTDLKDSSTYPLLFDRLAKPQNKDDTKWSKEELEKLAGLNFIRVFDEVEKIRDKNENVNEDVISDADLKKEDITCNSDLSK